MDMNKGQNQGIAVDIELLLRNEFNNVDPKTFVDLIGSNSIRTNINGFYYGLGILLLRHYSVANANELSTFIDDMYEILGKKMDEIPNEKVEEIMNRFYDLYNRILD